MNWQSFQRDFTVWSGANAGQCNTPAFDAAFPVGRMVRVHTQADRSFFTTISAASCIGNGPVTLTLTRGVPAACNANNGWISPVNTMRYTVENATGDEASRTGGANMVAVLHRTEVDPSNKGLPLTVPGSTQVVDDRSVLDYVINFSLDFMIARGAPPQVDFVPTTDAVVRATPQQVRGVIINLAARTAEHEPEFTSNILGGRFPLRTAIGGARVRTLRAEILLPNIANRGLM
jgi:hypothetical protein